jgi:hypothetical protein
VPKKPKMAICPRCHRTIPAGELAEHLRHHKGKLPMHLKSSTGPKARTDRVERPEKMRVSQVPSFEEFFKAHTAGKPVKSNLSEGQIRSKFEIALKDVGATYSSLKLDAIEEPGFIEIFIDEKRNLTLKYSPLALRTITERAIDALLLHEACHASTLPDSLLRVPDVGDDAGVSFMVNYLTNYDEYLAHVGFVGKFRQDPRYEALKEQQESLFGNFETIIESMKVMIDAAQKAGKGFNQYYVLEQLSSIVYDTMFFFVANDPSFLKWCKDHSLDGLGEFIGWVYEDFEHIRELGLPLKESHDKVIVSGTLSMSVNPLKLLFLSQIEFAETARGLHEDMIEQGRDTDLVKLWENRRLAFEK